ncbi:MAG TPA: LytTR family DNA-binding domain-containing protein [Pyrinomonadaceae bacterium]|jgi:two-component system LytT family response regulator
MNKLRTVIIDDEAAARRRVVQFLNEISDVELVGECEDGRQAIDLINDLRPDLLLLDVQMPNLDGFGVVREIGPSPAPAIIFTTAYDQFALQAFEANALDYLLKPFSRERFGQAVSRARERISEAAAGRLGRQLQALLRSLEAEPARAKRLEVRSSGCVIFLPVTDIDWIGSADNYLEVHAGRETHLIRETMGRIEAKLDPGMFVRIHRSTIVNVTRVKLLRPLFNGDQLLTLSDGTQLTVGRNHRDKFISTLRSI